LSEFEDICCGEDDDTCNIADLFFDRDITGKVEKMFTYVDVFNVCPDGDFENMFVELIFLSCGISNVDERDSEDILPDEDITGRGVELTLLYCEMFDLSYFEGDIIRDDREDKVFSKDIASEVELTSLY
jgi:hypothetical protein